MQDKTYDIFISFKNPGAGESDNESKRLAERLYYSLYCRGYEVFYSEIVLRNYPGTDYFNKIKEALDEARLMLLVFTKSEELSSEYMKYEWSTFRRSSKIIFPVFKDMDADDLAKLPPEIYYTQGFDLTHDNLHIKYMEILDRIDVFFDHDSDEQTAKSRAVEPRTVWRSLAEDFKLQTEERKPVPVESIVTEPFQYQNRKPAAGSAKSRPAPEQPPVMERKPAAEPDESRHSAAQSSEADYSYARRPLVHDFRFTYIKEGIRLDKYTGHKKKVIILEKYGDVPVVGIGKRAFSGCKSLTSITIPDSVTSIGDRAFENCESLNAINIPDGVTSIGDWTFSCCESLTTIIIPNGVTSIGDWAFWQCKSLTSINISEGVTSIGKRVFWGCESLTSINIPGSVRSIGNAAFEYCKSLTSISIPEGVTSIGDGAFNHCFSLTSIVIPGSVRIIGDDAFYLCDELTVKCPRGSYAQSYCANNGIKKYIFTEPETAAKNMYAKTEPLTMPDYEYTVTTDGINLERYICRQHKAEVNVPNAYNGTSVISIGDNTFADHNEIVTISLPSGVKSIGRRSFMKCGRLQSVVIPDSVTSIGDMAFEGCGNLRSLFIPDSVMHIGYDAFYLCVALTVYCTYDSYTQRWCENNNIKYALKD